MMTPGKLTLLVLFFGGLLGLWWADYARIPTARERELASGLVLPELREVKPGDVKRIVIESQGASGGSAAIDLERREDGSWRMTRPVRSRANGPKIEYLIQNLKDLPKSREAGTIAGKVADYGLEKPSVVVSIYGPTESEPVARLSLGNTIGDRRYVRDESGEGIDVVESRRLATLDTSAQDWRQTSLFSLSPIDVEGVSLAKSGRDLKARREGGRWEIVQPAAIPGDETKWEGLVADLVALNVADGAAGFVEDEPKDLAKYGLATPEMTIELRPRETGRPQTVTIGSAVPGAEDRRYARIAGGEGVVKIPAHLVDSLSIEPMAWRSKRLANIDPARVSHVEVRSGGVSHLMTLSRQGWQAQTPAAGKADDQSVRRLLAALTNAQALDMKPAAESGADPETTEIKLWQAAEGTDPTVAARSPQGAPALDVRLGSPDKRRSVVYARVAGDPAILALPPDVLQAIPTGPLAFRDRSLTRGNDPLIDEITVQRAGKMTQIVSGENPIEFPKWRMVKPVRGPIDAETVARLVVLLARLRAESLVTDSPGNLKTFGLDAPVLTIEWSGRVVAGAAASAAPPGSDVEKVSRTLTIGGPSPGRPGSRYASVTGVPTIFTLGPDAVAILGSELRNHKILSLRLERVTGLNLRWLDHSLHFSRQPRPFAGPDDWKPDAAADVSGFDVSRLNPLLTTLTNLSTPEFVQYEGTIPADYGLVRPKLAVEVDQGAVMAPKVLRVGERTPDGKGRYATVEPGRTGAVFLLPAAFWDDYVGDAAKKAELPENVFAPGREP